MNVRQEVLVVAIATAPTQKEATLVNAHQDLLPTKMASAKVRLSALLL